jgi:hypothetical protein
VGGREFRSSTLRLELVDRLYELCERRASGLYGVYGVTLTSKPGFG